MLLKHLARQLVKSGTLTLVEPSGARSTFGDDQAPRVTMHLHDRRLLRELFWYPELKLGEAFMDGRLTLEEGDVYDLLALLMDNLYRHRDHWLRVQIARCLNFFKPLQQFNPIRRAQRNVAHHYDLSGALYDLFLDKDRQYSCAYFMNPDDDLEQAQFQKKHHIAAKLLLEPGCKVLDIGSGWGGLALYLASIGASEVTGITLSEEQLKVAQQRAAEAGLGDRVHFALRDYREETRRYDRIVSVGMFEHVGVNHYRAFFSKIRDSLTDDGVALLHTIGRADGPGTTNAWIRKYIFPGAYCPALSEVLPAIEASGLFITDIEILRLHYAETLKEWRRRFVANWDEVTQIYDERFCRMWEFYLAGSEAAFRYGGQIVFQIQLAKRQEAVPLTRDYVTDWERAQFGERSVAA